MAHVDEKGFIELTREDKESLTGKTRKGWATNIINFIIWGDKKYFYDNKKLEEKKDERF